MHAPNPDGFYDEVISDATYEYCSKTNTPIRDSVVDAVVEEFGGQTDAVELVAPDGKTHEIVGSGVVPKDVDTLVDQINTATSALGPRPVSLVKNLFGVHLGALHFTDDSARYVVGEEIFSGEGQRGTGDLPGEFEQLAVKLVHTYEGFQLSESKPYHWVEDLPWSKTQREAMSQAMGGRNGMGSDSSDDSNRGYPLESDCWVLNLPSVFPGRSFGQTTNAPATVVTHTTGHTERVLKDTLLTERQSQYRAIQTGVFLLSDPNLDHNESFGVGFETTVKGTFDLSDSGFRSLKSKMDERKRKAFQTVRELSDSDEFNYVMEEFAETIDELGQLASLGAQYRRENGKSPGFY